MKYIKTSKGHRVTVSDIDYDYLSLVKWYFDGRYVRNNKLGLLHRVVLSRAIDRNIPKGFETDHINGNPSDNRRENLRLATISENHMNSGKRIGKSGFKGVRKQTGRNSWQANITFNQKKIFIGTFSTPQAAALAYNKKAKELYGEYAYLNIV